jgi:hypothetical protein
MLFILIPSIWLTLAAFFVILCRGAGRADTLLEATHMPTGARASAVSHQPALVVFEDQRAGTLSDSRLRWSGRSRARGVRGRAGRCAAGS